jgi:phosphatidylglycerol:prolipoprotein diacylglycerol transferase
VGAVADSVGLAMPLSLAIARFGCFLNGCCGGKPSGLPWAVTFPGSTMSVHPTQLYELALDLALFAFLLWIRKRLKHDWDLFLLSLAGYALIRFAMEFLRVHADPRAAPFFQALSAAIFLMSVGILLYRYRASPGSPDLEET